MCGKNYKVFATLQYKFLNSEAVDIQVEKTTRPFRYDLNQIPYDYTVEVRNRFKGLDLIDRVLDELSMKYVILYRRNQDHPQEK